MKVPKSRTVVSDGLFPLTSFLLLVDSLLSKSSARHDVMWFFSAEEHNSKSRSQTGELGGSCLDSVTFEQHMFVGSLLLESP